jgi:hypothetical protein
VKTPAFVNAVDGIDTPMDKDAELGVLVPLHFILDGSGIYVLSAGGARKCKAKQQRRQSHAGKIRQKRMEIQWKRLRKFGTVAESASGKGRGLSLAGGHKKTHRCAVGYLIQQGSD